MLEIQRMIFELQTLASKLVMGQALIQRHHVSQAESVEISSYDFPAVSESVISDLATKIYDTVKSCFADIMVSPTLEMVKAKLHLIHRKMRENKQSTEVGLHIYHLFSYDETFYWGEQTSGRKWAKEAKDAVPLIWHTLSGEIISNPKHISSIMAYVGQKIRSTGKKGSKKKTKRSTIVDENDPYITLGSNRSFHLRDENYPSRSEQNTTTGTT